MTDMFDPDKDCYDCGSTPKWVWGKSRAVEAPDHLCRRCADKGGNRVFVRVDPDKLEKLIGFNEARRLLEGAIFED